MAPVCTEQAVTLKVQCQALFSQLLSTPSNGDFLARGSPHLSPEPNLTRAGRVSGGSVPPEEGSRIRSVSNAHCCPSRSSPFLTCFLPRSGCTNRHAYFLPSVEAGSMGSAPKKTREARNLGYLFPDSLAVESP